MSMDGGSVLKSLALINMIDELTCARQIGILPLNALRSLQTRAQIISRCSNSLVYILV